VFATLVVTAALVLGAVLLLVVQQRALVTGLEQSVVNRAADVAALAKRRALPKELTAAREDDALTQVIDAKGNVLATSENLKGEGRAVKAVPPASGTVLVTQRVSTLGSSRFRIAVRRVDTSKGPVTVYAGNSLDTVDDAAQKLATILGIGLPLLVGLVGFTTWKVTGRALRPVEAIRSEVSTIGEGELHRRVPEPPTDDEVGRLARTMNAMLARLDDAADRQRRFVSDASHELQSPLTSLRARLEVNLASVKEPDWRADEQDSLLEIIEMQRLVDNLLTLARLDARVSSPHLALVEIDDLVQQEAMRLRARGNVAVDVHQVSAGQVLGDIDQLRRALRNVLDNAERYATRQVSASVHDCGETVEVRIIDDGPGIPDDDRERIFERFARIDDARTRDGSSTGLGLAIAREILIAHGGAIEVEPNDHGACFFFCFPSAGTTD
jgi:signal transduction histidine kinase